MNKSQLFKTAHKLAKSVIKSVDNYRVTFGAAIKAILEGFVMTTKSIADQLIEAGAKVWEKGDMKRIYINTSDVFVKAFDLAENALRSDARTFKTKTYFSNNVCHTDDGAIANVMRSLNVQVVRI